MSDQPKPTGEWTAKIVKNEPFTGWRVAIGDNVISGNLFLGDAENLRDAITAALAASQGAQHHMEACRALLNVPDDEVLYGAIEELQQQLADEREKVKSLTEQIQQDFTRQLGYPLPDGRTK